MQVGVLMKITVKTVYTNMTLGDLKEFVENINPEPFSDEEWVKLMTPGIGASYTSQKPGAKASATTSFLIENEP